MLELIKTKNYALVKCLLSKLTKHVKQQYCSWNNTNQALDRVQYLNVSITIQEAFN